MHGEKLPRKDKKFYRFIISVNRRKAEKYSTICLPLDAAETIVFKKRFTKKKNNKKLEVHQSET